MITLALKRCLSDRSYVGKQVIRLGVINRVLAKLIEVNPLYQNIQIDPSWESVSQENLIQNYGVYSLTKIKSVLKVKLMIVMRISKEIIMFMKKRYKILFRLYQLFSITLKAHQYLLFKFLI